MEGLSARVVLSAAIMTLLAISCSAPREEGAEQSGKAAILDSVYAALTREDCATAIGIIEPLYASANTDNDVRLARAAAQGCKAGANNMFSLLTKIAGNSSSLAGNKFWELITEMFYHQTESEQDKRISAAGSALDALMAAVTNGTVISAANQVNAGTNNVGTLIADDRLDDANLYMVFSAMAMAGNIQTRYGQPQAPAESNYKRGKILGSDGSNVDGWTRYEYADDNACGYAASIINMLDAMEVVATKINGKYATDMKNIQGAFADLINNACDAACRGEIALDVDYAGVGCGDFPGGDPTGFPALDFTADHLCKGTTKRPCMTALRNREACAIATPTVTSIRASCAAAGIARFVSNSVMGWQQ